MDDRILHVKKKMRQILKAKGWTRLEKNRLAKQASRELNEEELQILIKECCRDYESYNRIGDIKEMITVIISGLGLIITIICVVLEDALEKQEITFSDLTTMIVGITVFVIFVTIILSWVQNYRSSNMCIIKHMIDILEE